MAKYGNKSTERATKYWDKRRDSKYDSNSTVSLIISYSSILCSLTAFGMSVGCYQHYYISKLGVDSIQLLALNEPTLLFIKHVIWHLSFSTTSVCNSSNQFYIYSFFMNVLASIIYSLKKEKKNDSSDISSSNYHRMAPFQYIFQG